MLVAALLLSLAVWLASWMIRGQIVKVWIRSLPGEHRNHPDWREGFERRLASTPRSDLADVPKRAWIWAAVMVVLFGALAFDEFTTAQLVLFAVALSVWLGWSSVKRRDEYNQAAYRRAGMAPVPIRRTTRAVGLASVYIGAAAWVVSLALLAEIVVRLLDL
jgi:hypothetical protein